MTTSIHRLLYPFLCVLLLLGPFPVYSQKVPKNLKALRAQRVQAAKNTAARTPAALTAKRILPPSVSAPSAAPAQQQVAVSVPSCGLACQPDPALLAAEIRSQQPADPATLKKDWVSEDLWGISAQLLAQYPKPRYALRALWEMENNYNHKHFFSYLALTYYKQHFHDFTPHLWDFFKRIGHKHNFLLEETVIRRMHFLALNKKFLTEAAAPGAPDSAVRLRYLRNTGYLKPELFKTYHLALSIEQNLHPANRRAAVRHVNAKSQFPVGKTHYPVYQYNGPLEFLPNLYLYLINGKQTKKPVTIFFDPDARIFIMFNEDRSLWLRMTPHEYSVFNPHIHLNEARAVSVTNELGMEIHETVNYNLIIPLAQPAWLPPDGHEDYLYETMVLKPLRHFSGNPHIKIIQKTIF